MFVFDTHNQRAIREQPMPSSKQRLQAFQREVGGYITCLPHPKGSRAPFTAYANEEGMLQNLPSNFLAWGVLRHLGFIDSTMGMGFYFGNVVLVGRNEQALTDKAKKQVREALAKYLKEMGEEKEEQDDPAKETGDVSKEAQNE